MVLSYKLSICIPTYNRSEYLNECLRSIFISAAGYEHEIELIVSDNASTDNTFNLIKKIQKLHPWVRYNLNEKNIGPELNFRHVVSLANAENVLVFGDDDKMGPFMISKIIESIRSDYNLTICNYSVWDKNFLTQKKQSAFAFEQDLTFNDPNVLMKYFGLHLSFISSVVINKSLFLKLPKAEYEIYKKYGLSFLFAVYNGILNDKSKIKFIAEPIFCNRGGNSGDYDWYKYFVTGSSLIFEALQLKGYSKNSLQIAKKNVLKDFVIKNFLWLRLKMNRQDNKKVFILLFKHYKIFWQFWVYCFLGLLIPLFLIRLGKFVRQKIRFHIS